MSRALAILLCAYGVAAAPHDAATRERKAQGATSDGFPRVVGQTLVNPDGSELRLRGIGIGNWLLPEGYMWGFRKGPTSPRQIQELVSELLGPDESRRFWRAFRESYITREDIHLLRRIGLNTVRVPFDYRLLAPEDEPGQWREEGFALLDQVIAWCHDEGLLVILDMHAAPGGQTGRNIDDSWGFPFLFESPESQDRTVDVWRRIAARYTHETAVLGYDLLNEPIPNDPAYASLKPRLEPLYRRIVTAIREVDPNHVVFLEGAHWDTDFSIFGPPFAANLIYSFHKYWNTTDLASLAPYLEFRQRHGVPIWLGESGENTDEWIDACRRLVEAQGIGWCFWPYKKLGSTRGIVSIPQPAGWDAIVAYASGRTPDFEANARIRPSLDEARRALWGFVENAHIQRCRLNQGYVEALGLHLPGAPQPRESR